MGVRNSDHIELTVACAFVDRYIADAADYAQKKTDLTTQVEQIAKRVSTRNIHASVNAADDIDSGSLYLTVTGTSAESGDDGEVGRGNRVNGLITPYRPMNMEAAAGKNPTTHVGKIYNLAAWDIADKLAKKDGIDLEVGDRPAPLVGRAEPVVGVRV